MFRHKRLAEFLKNPVVDKCLGFLSVSVSIYVLYVFIGNALNGNLNVYSAAIALNMLIIVITTMIRRTATRVSTNPIFWAITFMRSYWAYIVLSYIYVYKPVHLLSQDITNALLLIGVGIIIYSRLSLGRNTGFIPARRRLITTGAYGWVRHPIHTGELFFLASFILASFTWMNFFS